MAPTWAKAAQRNKMITLRSNKSKTIGSCLKLQINNRTAQIEQPLKILW